MRYIKWEFVSIVIFVLLIIINRLLDNSILANPLFETIMIIIYLVILFLILIVIPSMMLLSVRDKVSPNSFKNMKPSGKLEGRNYRAGLILLIANIAFSWLFYYLSIRYNNKYLLYLTGITTITVIIILHKVWKKPFDLKGYLVFIGLIAITFLLILLLFQSLLLIPFYL